MTLSLDVELCGRHARLRIGPWRKPWVGWFGGTLVCDLGWLAWSLCGRRQRWVK